MCIFTTSSYFLIVDSRFVIEYNEASDPGHVLPGFYQSKHMATEFLFLGKHCFLASNLREQEYERPHGQKKKQKGSQMKGYKMECVDGF